MTSVGDLPDEAIIRILSLLRFPRDVLCSALVSTRWLRLAKLVTHFCFYWDKPGAEEEFIRWLGYDHNQLRQLLIIKRLEREASLAWLPAVEKKLRSLSISSCWNGGQLRDIWCSISAFRELRCLHIRGNIAPEMPTSPYPNLRLCMIRCYGFTPAHAEQLLELCPSLLYFRIELLEVQSPGLYQLRSQSLDFLHVSVVCGKSSDNLTVSVDMPKLRWLLLPVPSIHLEPSTRNVDWVWIHQPVLEIWGLGYSKPSRLRFSSGWNMSAYMISKALSVFGSSVLGGVKEVELAVYDTGDRGEMTCVDVTAFLELFPRVETLITHFASIPALKWSGRELPLNVRLEFMVRATQGLEIKFLREMMKTSSGVRLECQGYFRYREMMPPPFQEFSLESRERVTLSRPGGTDEATRPLVELAMEFPGRVSVHPLKDIPDQYGPVWRTWRARVQVEGPYPALDHWCNEMHEGSDKPCAWMS